MTLARLGLMAAARDLPPPPLTNVVHSGGTTLTWDASPISDLSIYRVYNRFSGGGGGGANEPWVLRAETLATTADISTWGTTLYLYAVDVVDTHGNVARTIASGSGGGR